MFSNVGAAKTQFRQTVGAQPSIVAVDGGELAIWLGVEGKRRGEDEEG